MSTFELRYVLRRIRSARQDPEPLAKALLVYHGSTPQLEATSTNEIQYWTDHYNTQFSDELFVFVLEVNGISIGFAQCVLFAAEHFIIVDYITVDDKHKTVGNFLLFYEQIRSYFQEHNHYYDFIVVEILQEIQGAYTASSDFWRTIMALERFRVVDAKYHQLQLGRTKFETDVPARLLIGARGDLTNLRSETYLMIVETILFKHYLRWYEPFQDESERISYRAKAQMVFDEIRSSVGSKHQLELSHIAGEILPTGSLNGTYGANKNIIIFESLSYLVLLIVLVGSTVSLRLNATEVLLLAIGALVVRMALLSVFVPAARSSLQASLVALQSLLGKKDAIGRKLPKRTKSRN